MIERDASLLREYEGCELGDQRRTKRLISIAQAMRSNPAESFPRRLVASKALEAGYRFFANDGFDAHDMLGSHLRQSWARAQRHRVVRAVHDTTDFVFKGAREDLGIVEGRVVGFFGHCCLLVGGDELREPLGLGAFHHYTYENTEERRKLTKSQLSELRRTTPRAEKISHRWEATALAAEKLAPRDVKVVHVMDQEADDFHVFAALLDAQSPFVIRASAHRQIETNRRLSDVLSMQPQQLFRNVRLTSRQPTTKKSRYLPRDERAADLVVQWSGVTIPRPERLDCERTNVDLNVVRVFENAPPDGEQAVDWVLLTNEPVDTLEDAAAIIDHYRARWLIEEFFKALKTGCAVEKRQLTTYDGLVKAVALFMPIAWEMLRIRHIARATPERPATEIISDEDLEILRGVLEVRAEFKLGRAPSVRDLLLALAKLGGHIKNNGEPGWQTLGHGFNEFVQARAIWKRARKM